MLQKGLTLFFFWLNCLVFSGIVSAQVADKNTIPPDNCQIIGEIIKISPSRTPDGVCAEYACEAEVCIVEIIGYGMAFNAPLSLGEVVSVHFVFTLSATENIFPELNEALPGLAEGEKFEAFMQGFEKRGGKYRYNIYGYQKQ